MASGLPAQAQARQPSSEGELQSTLHLLALGGEGTSPVLGCSHVTHTPFPTEGRADTDSPATERRGASSPALRAHGQETPKSKRLGVRKGPPHLLGPSKCSAHHREDGKAVPSTSPDPALLRAGAQQSWFHGSELPSQRSSNSSGPRAGISWVSSIPDVAVLSKLSPIKLTMRDFPVVQWLRLYTPNAGGPGSIPGQGTRARTPQLNLPHVATKIPQVATKILCVAPKTWLCQNK